VAEISGAEAYRVLIGSRIRSQLAYRTSFWLTVATSLGIGLVEFVEIYAIFANVPVFGGLDLRQSALVFALGNMGFALADAVFGQLDTIPTYLRWDGWRSFWSDRCRCCCSLSPPTSISGGWAGSPRGC
jgi:ABC-2 type transport system permease protein